MIPITLVRAAYWCLTLCTVAAGAFAQSPATPPAAQDVLNHMSEAYSRARSLHIVAKREEIWTKAGRNVVTSSDLEIALATGRKYFVRMKTDGQEAIAVSNGEHIWKAVPTKKQWMQVAAAALETNGENEAPDPRSRDLYSSLSRMLAGRYIALAKLAENPGIAGEEDVKIEGRKIRCYIVRARVGGTEHELWIDQQRFVVLQHKERGEANGMAGDIRLKVSAIEVNSSVADSTFQFEPGKGWMEAEMLFLPGEERMLLAGSRAANFTLKTLEGEPVALDQTRGKVVVLDFWATWCPPCREELPFIEKLRGEFAGQVQFFGVNDEDSGTVKDFVRKHSY
jgi:thiol-disulfide isomerase/thioredoxin